MLENEALPTEDSLLSPNPNAITMPLTPTPTDELDDSQESGGIFIGCKAINSEHICIDCN